MLSSGDLAELLLALLAGDVLPPDERFAIARELLALRRQVVTDGSTRTPR